MCRRDEDDHGCAPPQGPRRLSDVDSASEQRQIKVRGFTDQDIRFLFGRRQRVLARLSVITGGTTSAVPDGTGLLPRRGDVGYVEPDLTTGKGRALADSPGARPPRGGESRLPPGVSDRADMTRRREGPPSRDFDMLGHYVWKFTKAKGNYWLTEKLCAEAERDLRREVGGALYAGSNEDGTIRDYRIIEWHAGLKPWEVATFEDCTPRYVTRLRVSHGLTPEEGLEREPEPVAVAGPESEGDRTARIVRLSAAGCSQRAIALEVGVNQSTVSRVLAGAVG